MIEARGEIAENFGGSMAEKNRTEITRSGFKPVTLRARVERKLKMFRRLTIRQLHCAIEGVDNDGTTAVLKALSGDGIGGKARKNTLDLALNRGCEGATRGDEYGLRVGIMLCLRIQVGRDPRRVRRVVRDDQYLARSGEKVNAHLSENVFLRGSYVLIARTRNNVYARNGFGAVCHGPDCLSAADGEDTLDSAQCRDRDGAPVSPGEVNATGRMRNWRRAKNYLPNASGPRRRSTHDNARNKRKTPTGNVETRTIHGMDSLAGNKPGRKFDVKIIERFALSFRKREGQVSRYDNCVK